MAKVKRKRVGRRQPRRGETWREKIARVGKTLLAENEEGREARKALRGVVKDIQSGKNPLDGFLDDEGYATPRQKPKKAKKK